MFASLPTSVVDSERLTIALEAEEYQLARCRLAGWWTMDRSILTPAEVVLLRVSPT